MNKGHEYQQLSRFAGRWHTQGHMPQPGGDIPVRGTDTYEWLPGGYFLLHRVDVMVGNDKNETTEIIGWDAAANRYTMQHYDNKGNSGYMTAVCEDDTWTFSGETLRFTGGFKHNDREFSGIWYRLNDNKEWIHFMDIKLTRSA